MIKTCKRCAIEQPLENFHKSSWNKVDGRQDWCKPCRKIQAEKTRDKDLERYRQWYCDNKDHVLDQNAKWREAHPDQVRVMKRVQRKRAYARDPEKHRHRSRDYNRKNPDVVWVRHMRKLTEKWDCQDISATYADWLDVLEHYGSKCYYCGADEKPYTEHKTPLARGGAHSKTNIVPACNRCNVSKGQLTEAEFRDVLVRGARGKTKRALRLAHKRGELVPVAA